MKTTIGQISKFYDAHPECIGEVDVFTRFGYYPILAAGITKKNSQVYEMCTSSYTLRADKDHRVLADNWTKIKHLNIGDAIHTSRGVETIKSIKATNKYIDLYDIQVGVVEEYYSNGIVSHNSSLIESIYYALYGRTLRDLKIQQIPNSYTKGPCKAVLDFEVNEDAKITSYQIIRSLRPTKLILMENGNNITKSTVPQTTALLQEIIHCSNTVFENSVVMGANNATSFMSQKKVEKRKFLEGILNLSIFGEMLGIARGDFNDTKYNFDLQDSKLQERIATLATYKEQSERQRLLRKARKDELQTKLNTIAVEIEATSKSLKTEMSVEDLSALRIKYDKLLAGKRANQSNSKELIKQEVALEFSEKTLKDEAQKLRDKPDACPECNRPYPADEKLSSLHRREEIVFDINIINKKIAGVKDKIKYTDEQFSKVEAALDTLLQKQDNAEDVTKHNATVLWKVKQLNKSVVDFQKELNSNNKEVDDFVNIITKMTDKVAELDVEVKKLDVKLEILQAAKFILSEEGIRSFIVKKILRVLNSKLNTYLKELDSNTKCEFNEYFEEQMWDNFGNDRSYHNFSNGEQRRIDLAILFAFQDIRKLQADVSMNISIYDELLDSSLDRKGAELVLFLLKQRAARSGECVYIVSHRKEAESTFTNKIITLQKKNGVTTMVD